MLTLNTNVGPVQIIALNEGEAIDSLSELPNLTVRKTDTLSGKMYNYYFRLEAAENAKPFGEYDLPHVANNVADYLAIVIEKDGRNYDRCFDFNDREEDNVRTSQGTGNTTTEQLMYRIQTSLRNSTIDDMIHGCISVHKRSFQAFISGETEVTFSIGKGLAFRAHGVRLETMEADLKNAQQTQIFGKRCTWLISGQESGGLGNWLKSIPRDKLNAEITKGFVNTFPALPLEHSDLRLTFPGE